MQTFKEAAQEHVRWRSVRADFSEPTVAVVACGMRALGMLWVPRGANAGDLGLLRGTGAPGSASEYQARFLENAHKRSLGVLQLRKDGALCDEYRALLQDFPAITLQKVGAAQLATPEGRVKALGQFVAKHNGEIVELEKSR